MQEGPAMTQQPTHCLREQRSDVASARDAAETANFDDAWRSFCDELDSRIVARFAAAFDGADGEVPNPAVLADLALQRALMP
jgi:hypothetical protein